MQAHWNNPRSRGSVPTWEAPSVWRFRRHRRRVVVGEFDRRLALGPALYWLREAPAEVYKELMGTGRMQVGGGVIRHFTMSAVGVDDGVRLRPAKVLLDTCGRKYDSVPYFRPDGNDRSWPIAEQLLRGRNVRQYARFRLSLGVRSGRNHQEP